MKKLYGIGTGPGDPDLLTLKAVKLIKSADKIFAPNNRGKNMALTTAQEYINEEKLVLLDFPMGQTTKKTYKEAMEKIDDLLEDGQNGVFLNIGDSMIYSTFMNLVQANEKDHFVFECVPGIPSFVAAANSIQKNLVAKGENFLLADDPDRLVLDGVDSVAILKTSKNLKGLLEKLEEADFAYYYVARVSFPDQLILVDKEEILEEKNYMSLLLARKKSL